MRKFLITTGISTVFILFILIMMKDRNVPSAPDPYRIKALSGGEGLVNDQSREEWHYYRLRDPATGKIPRNIRRKELEFAGTLPNDAGLNGRVVDWVFRGPCNVGGRTRGMAVDIADENIILAGGVSGGMWRSEDSGITWEKATTSDQLHNVTCLVQDKRTGKTNTWYYGTGEGYGNSAYAYGAYFYGDGLYRSVDNGVSWSPVESTSSGTPHTFDYWDIIWNLALDPSNDTVDIIYVAGYGKIYKSTDGGDTWSEEITGGSYFTDIAVTSQGVAYATLSSDGSQRGIWRCDVDSAWVNITPTDTFPSLYDRIVIAVDPGDEDNIYFLGVTPGSGQPTTSFTGDTAWHSLWKYTYLSGDGTGGGGMWTNLSSNIPNNSQYKFDNFYAQGSYNLVIAVKPDDPDVVFIGGTNLYRSTDGFTSMNNTTQIGGYMVGSYINNWDVYEDHHPDQHVITFIPSDPDIMINANDGGVFKTNNCMDSIVLWESLNNCYRTTQLYTVSFDETSTNDIIVTGYQDNGNYYTNNDDPMSPWTLPLNGDGSFSYITPGSENYYLSKQNGKIFKMTLDYDGNATGFARIDPIGGSGYQFINQFTVDPNNTDVMYVPAGKRLWRNDSLSFIPLAGNYDSISTGWSFFSDTIASSSLNFTSVAVSKEPSNIVYAGTSNRVVYRIDTADTGDPELVDIVTYSMANGFTNCIAIDPRDADKVLIVYSNYSLYSLYYTENGGDDWDKAAGNLEQTNTGSGNGPSCRWATILPVDNGTLYFVGTSTGLYATDTIMGINTTWIQVGTNTIGNVVVDMVKSRETDGLVLAATHGGGLYSAHVTTVEDVMGCKDPEMTDDMELALYPYPVMNSFTISFSMEKTNDVRLNIFDGTGRHIKTIVNNQLIKGKYNYFVDCSGYAQGIYYCQLDNGTAGITKKIIKY